jgi:hypothetical protein
MKRTTPPYDRPLRVGLAAGLLTFCLCAMGAWAGDLTTDNLTVNQNLTVKDAQTGSAPTNGLVAYYSFSTNATPVPDDSGNGYTGTLYGATWVTNGVTGGGYSFDGSNDYVKVSSTFGLGTIMTMSSWIYLSDSSAHGMFVNIGQHGVGGPPFSGFGVGVGGPYPENAGNQLTAVNNGTAWDTTGVNVGIGWHHICCVMTNATTFLSYIDGNLVNTYTGSTFVAPAGGESQIGGYQDTPTLRWFNGIIDEVRIYNRALSSNEVHELYLNDVHLTAGSSVFETDVTCEQGIQYIKPLGDVLMGSFTNNP